MFAVALLMLSSAGTQVSCEQALYQTLDYKSPATLADWSRVICATYAADFDAFGATILTRTTSVETERFDAETRGHWTVSPINMGRVQMKWTAEAMPSTAITLWLKVDGYKQIPVFARDMNNEEIVSTEDTSSSLINVAQLMREGREVATSFSGMSVVRAVRKGEPVFQEMLRPAPFVPRNEPVDVVLQSGNLFIKAKGIALNTGWQVNDRVQVKVEGAEAAVSANVKSENLVYVTH